MDAAINPVFKLLVQTVSNTVPNLVHICPYWVRVDELPCCNLNNLVNFRDLSTPTTCHLTWTKYSACSLLAIIQTLSCSSTIWTSKFSRSKCSLRCAEKLCGTGTVHNLCRIWGQGGGKEEGARRKSTKFYMRKGEGEVRGRGSDERGRGRGWRGRGRGEGRVWNRFWIYVDC